MNKELSVLGVDFTTAEKNEILNLIHETVDSEDRVLRICTPNPEIVLLACRDIGYRSVLNSFELTLPDGIGIVYASRIYGKPLKERIPGIEIAEYVIKTAAEKKDKFPVFLLGGKEGTAEDAAHNLCEKYPGLVISGTQNGYFDTADEQENDSVVKKINSSGAKAVIVCMGAPKQERWINDNYTKLNNAVILGGFGGSIDVFAGNVERAPDFYIKHKIEWLYRLIKEPRRIKRMIKLPGFIVKVIVDKYKTR